MSTTFYALTRAQRNTEIARLQTLGFRSVRTARWLAVCCRTLGAVGR